MSAREAGPAAGLSVVIVSHNTRTLLDRCLRELRAAAAAAGPTALEIVVVDNASTDDTCPYLAAQHPDVRLITNPDNRGFAAANNQGLRLVRHDIALLLNSDAFITAATLRGALTLLGARPHIGLVGVRIDNPDRTLQAAAGSFPSLFADWRANVGLDRLRNPARSATGRGTSPDPAPVDWVHGACMFVRLAALERVGPLDEAFFMYSEEVDWCRRFWRHGWEVWYHGGIAVVHVGGGSAGENDLGRRIALYRSRFGLRRRLGGPQSSAILWLGTVAGLALRALGRSLLESLTGGKIGRRSATADWRLLRAILTMDPLARWAAFSPRSG